MDIWRILTSLGRLLRRPRLKLQLNEIIMCKLNFDP